MNSRKLLGFRRDQASSSVLRAKCLAVLTNSFMVGGVKKRQNDNSFKVATFRNPSPWRQSGATLHLLPSFLVNAADVFNFEREKECHISQKSPLYLLCQRALQAAKQHLILLLPMQPLARPLVQPLLQSQAAAVLMLLPQPSLVASLARHCPSSNPTFSQPFALRSKTKANAVLPQMGRAAFCVSR